MYLKYYADTLKQQMHSAFVFKFFRGIMHKKAQAKGQKNGRAFFLERLLDWFDLKHLPQCTVLEIGAGDGWAMTYQQAGLRKIIIDQSPDFVEQYRANNCEFVCAHIERDDIHVPDGSVDLIVMNHVIEHIYDYEKLMAVCRRILKPHGVVYVRTPDIRKIGLRFYDDYTHVKPYTPLSLSTMMASQGFDEIISQPSDHARINLDSLTGYRYRWLWFNRWWAGIEIEAAYRKRKGGI